jgi:signal transduction histidine kinase
VRLGSIRLRITMLAGLIATVVLLLAGVVVVLVVEAQLENNLDRSLEQRADQIEQSSLSDPSASLFNSNSEDRFAQVLDARGRVLLATANIAGEPAVLAPSGDRQATVTRSDLPLEDDVFRVLIHRFDESGGARYVVVGENIDDLRDSVRALVITLAIVFPAAVAALAATVWWLVGRTLRPVEEIRREVEGIGLGELERRVPIPGSGDEIDRLAGTMNDMLARLESSSARQRQFVADVSHELRTPLTRMRTTLEVDLSSEGLDLTETCRGVLGDSIDMQALVDDLLFLARRDAGNLTVRREPVDLDVVIDHEVRALRAESDIEIDMSRVGAAVVSGDDRHIARLVRNLLSNAVRNAERDVRVIASTRPDGTVEMIVDDDGPGVPVADRQRVFERFVRLDESRRRDRGGTGLGLAIARDIAVSLGASIDISDSPSGGARFTVTFS